MQRTNLGSTSLRAMCLAALLAAAGTVAATAQANGATASQGAGKASGTVKEVHAGDILLTTASGDVTVSVPDSSKVVIVPPGSTSLGSATPGALADIQPGDRALVTGTPGSSANALSATRVIVMKSSAIAAVHAADSAAWAQGVGGIVKTVSASEITLSSGLKTITVDTTANTSVRRYAPGSVKFDDAVGSTVAAIQPGDQLRVRGKKSADGDTITADAIVSGNFKNYSGTIAAIDAAAQTITLKDLTTKKTVTVALTSSSDVRRLPAQAAAMMAARLKGGAASASGGGAEEQGASRPAGGEAAGSQAAGRGYGGAGGAAGAGGGRAAGADLSRMLSRLPTETLGGLKQGDAVMIVATAAAPEAGDKATAITLLVGVEAILAAPAGQNTTLSPWSVGSEGEMASGMGGGGGPQ